MPISCNSEGEITLSTIITSINNNEAKFDNIRLSELIDVNASMPSDGQIILYDALSGKWVLSDGTSSGDVKQSDWNQSSTSEIDFIKNKPDLSNYEEDLGNPTQDGMILSSNVAGNRGWIDANGKTDLDFEQSGTGGNVTSSTGSNASIPNSSDTENGLMSRTDKAILDRLNQYIDGDTIKITFKKMLEADRQSYTPSVGEGIWSTDEKNLYVGDNVTPGGINVSYIDDGTFVKTSSIGMASGVASLDSNGKIETSQLPALVINDTFIVSSQIEMLALTAQTGDIAIRTDIDKSFILKGTNSSYLGDWVELLSAGSGGGGSANLGYTPSENDGTITNTSGSNAVIPKAEGGYAGLMSASDKTNLEILITEIDGGSF